MQEELKPALSSIAALLAENQRPAALVGGGAVALRVYARFTEDLDAIVLDESPDYDRFVALAAEHGIYPAKAVSVANAKNSRILRMVHTESQVPIDFLFGMFRHEVNAVRRATDVEVNEVVIRVSSPEDLVVLKSLALRED